MKVGFVGLPGSGKTTLFTAVTKAPADAVEYGKTATRIVTVPDPRLERLRDIHEPRKFTPATFEAHDFPGIDNESSKASAAMFAAIREMDALAIVLRGFEDPNFAHDDPAADLARDWDSVLTDFQIADLDMIERRIERLEKSVLKPTPNQGRDRKELDLLKQCQDAVENGGRLADVDLGEGAREMLSGFRFLTQKPAMAVLSLDDDDDSADEKLAAFGVVCEQRIAVRGRLEAEIGQLDPEEASAFMEDFGITETVADSLTRELFDLIGLQNFFTTGPDEVRAWTLKKGDDAVIAAGKIHSDIARGFIRAEVIPYDSYVEAGGEKEAKAANLMRLEGKEYIVADGDVINFRFSV